MPTGLPGVLANERAAVALVALAITLGGVVFALNNGSVNAAAVSLKPNVTIATCPGGCIRVNITLPGGAGSYYSYYGYYGYYSYYGYTSTAPLPVTVIVAVESIGSDGTPTLVRMQAVQLKAFSSDNTATIEFQGLAAGSYNVKVFFWNGLLAQLSAAGKQWEPYAEPVFKLVTLTG